MTKQFLIVAVVETDDEQLGKSVASMSSYVERALMLHSQGVEGNRPSGLITRVKMIAGDPDGFPVITWGENDDKVFTATTILPPEGSNP